MNIKTGPHNLTTDLPPEHCIHVFTNRERLQTAAQTVLDSLTRNECDGSQWILIHDIPKSIIDSLDNDKNFLDGINYRFQWEGTTGLTKVIPSAAHEQINVDFTALVGDKLAGMGIHRRDRRWGLSTTYRPSTGTGCKGKQVDQIFLPTRPASPGAGRRLADPSSGNWGICIKGEAERGCEVVVQSHSNGKVRIVLLALVRRHEVTSRVWEMAALASKRPC